MRRRHMVRYFLIKQLRIPGQLHRNYGVLRKGDIREETPDIDILTNDLPFSQISSQLMKNANSWMNGAEMSRIWDARNLALDVNKHFERYIPVTYQNEANRSLDIWCYMV